VCEYDGVETTVDYNYGTEIVKVEVAPDVYVHTDDCVGSACDLVFENIDAETGEIFEKVYDFNKLEVVRYPVSENTSDRVVCQDSRAKEIKGKLGNIGNKVEREFDRVVDQGKRAGRKAEEDGKDIIEDGKRFIDSLFN